jgi:hypothetical protein
VSEKKKFLLRIDADIFAAIEKWAADDLRSVNSQIEYLLTNAARSARRIRPGQVTNPGESSTENERNETV